MAGVTNSVAESADPLAELRDIHLPDAVGYWPLATGWWLLLAGAVVLAGLTFWAVRRYRRNAYRRAALKELDKVYLQYVEASKYGTDGSAGRQYLQQVNRLLKQVYFTRAVNRVAGLSSDVWVSELQRVAPGVSMECFAGQLADLYRPDPDVRKQDVELIRKELRRWLQKHKSALLMAVPAREPANV